MYLDLVLKTIGLLLMIFSLNIAPAIIIDIIYNAQQFGIFLLSFVLTLFSGLVIWFPFRHVSQSFRIREAVLLVVGFWLILSLFASLPFVISTAVSLSFTEGFFEAMSGLTTTGATVITNLDDLPKSILYYRQQLQWLGGMGIIVLAVSILPMLGVGGMGLYRAETSGISQEKLTPKLAQTASILWRIYSILTLACALAYYAGGMSFFDALTHSFSTIAIGGFSTHNENLGYFNSSAIELVAIIFMLIAGINFSLHFLVYQKRNFWLYLRDSEFKAYMLILTLLILTVLLVLWTNAYYDSFSANLRNTVFHVVSLMTTTGFVTQNFHSWPIGIPIVLILASSIGACVGSTGGGIKVVRILLMFKLGMREIKKLIHPSAKINIKLNKKSVPDKILISVWGFFALYVMSFVTIIILLLLTGVDELTAFSAVTATINNLGPGLGEVTFNYKEMNDIAKWILSLTMLLGRLEILTLIALLHKTFWRY